jgi:ElaB/YqjD/DUF883 family membrane-anchored ribosome-binding protein
MTIDRDLLIRRVAEKHRLVLTEDDPLIASVTLHEVIFESHTEQLIQQMDVQNARVLAALQTTIANAKAEQRQESERLRQMISALYQKNLDDYRQVTENCLAVIRALATEANSARQYAWIAVAVATAFGLLFFCANLYLLLIR